ncbi:hypothetical protein [Paraburkholderia kururiensis]|uniref:hypothetical protein n=1 Tax=Paraburkholderia kururiensis TaxID=984307 RepID=UPI0005A99082|nr:hypothetical protein [Paraburkholderia kururiensis]
MTAPNWREAVITINGHCLTDAQSTTVRTALESLAMSLNGDAPLGDDEHGRRMTAAYRARLEEIRTFLYGASA